MENVLYYQSTIIYMYNYVYRIFFIKYNLTGLSTTQQLITYITSFFIMRM